MKKNRNLSSREGFTMIEVLVVATIIGVLASIGLVSYQSANKKSRDGKRKADMEQIRSALEIHKSDNGDYPATGDLAELVPNYMSSIPEPPANSSIASYNAGYTSSDGTTYSICQDLEVDLTEYCVNNP